MNEIQAVASAERPPLASTPALAAALRHTQRRWTLPTAPPPRVPLVPMYRIPPGDPAHEAHAAAQVLLAVAERLRRLAAAYGEWDTFDVQAYFDLPAPHAERLVHVAERVSTVHVTFYTDLLLPTFRRAAACWQDEFRPAYLTMRHALQHSDAPQTPIRAFAEDRLPCMIGHWQRLIEVTQATRTALRDELSYWAANGSAEERGRWRWAWRVDPTPGLPAELLPALAQTPTLTLAVDFPLPAHRQPGRLRRLRRLHARRRQGRLRSRSD